MEAIGFGASVVTLYDVARKLTRYLSKIAGADKRSKQYAEALQTLSHLSFIATNTLRPIALSCNLTFEGQDIVTYCDGILKGIVNDAQSLLNKLKKKQQSNSRRILGWFRKISWSSSFVIAEGKIKARMKAVQAAKETLHLAIAIVGACSSHKGQPASGKVQSRTKQAWIQEIQHQMQSLHTKLNTSLRYQVRMRTRNHGSVPTRQQNHVREMFSYTVPSQTDSESARTRVMGAPMPAGCQDEHHNELAGIMFENQAIQPGPDSGVFVLDTSASLAATGTTSTPVSESARRHLSTSADDEDRQVDESTGFAAPNDAMITKNTEHVDPDRSPMGTGCPTAPAAAPQGEILSDLAHETLADNSRELHDETLIQASATSEQDGHFVLDSHILATAIQFSPCTLEACIPQSIQLEACVMDNKGNLHFCIDQIMRDDFGFPIIALTEPCAPGTCLHSTLEGLERRRIRSFPDYFQVFLKQAQVDGKKEPEDIDPMLNYKVEFIKDYDKQCRYTGVGLMEPPQSPRFEYLRTTHFIASLYSCRAKAEAHADDQRVRSIHSREEGNVEDAATAASGMQGEGHRQDKSPPANSRAAEANEDCEEETNYQLGPFRSVPCYFCRRNALKPRMETSARVGMLLYNSGSYGYRCGRCNGKSWITGSKWILGR